MTAGTLAWGITFAVLCVLTGMTIGWQIGYRRCLKHAAEAAEDAKDAAVIAGWKELPDEDDRPAPPWPDAPPMKPASPGPLPQPGRGKHRHPDGPPRHAGRLPAPEPDRWTGTITVAAPLPAPVQAPPWDIPEPEPEPVTQVLEPTAVLPPDSLTDTAWTRRMAADMDAWIAEHIGATDSTLKEITK